MCAGPGFISGAAIESQGSGFARRNRLTIDSRQLARRLVCVVKKCLAEIGYLLNADWLYIAPAKYRGQRLARCVCNAT